jgi:hypothetical protein
MEVLNFMKFDKRIIRIHVTLVREISVRVCRKKSTQEFGLIGDRRTEMAKLTGYLGFSFSLRISRKTAMHL